MVLPDRVLSPGTVIVEDGRVTEIETGARSGSVPAPARFRRSARPDTRRRVHRRPRPRCRGVRRPRLGGRGRGNRPAAGPLRRDGVLPDVRRLFTRVLERLIESMRRARASARPHARVLPAHSREQLHQPGLPRRAAARLPAPAAAPGAGWACRWPNPPRPGTYSGADVLRVIEAHRRDVGIVTMAVELDGGLDLAKALVAAGHRVSLGHSAATYEQALAGIAAGARHATHLFNRMSPLSAPRPRPDGRRAGRGRRGGGDHLRRLSRASRGRDRGHPRQARRADHGHHRRQRRCRPAAGQQGLPRRPGRSP